jgi:hypothetical protein
MLWLREWYDIPAYLLGLMGILFLVIDAKNRLLFLLAIQYLLAAWLMLGSVQPGSTVAILLAGEFSSLMLLLSSRSAGSEAREVEDAALTANMLLRVSIGLLGILASIGALRAQIIQLSALNPIYALGAIFMMVSGFMQLGLTRNPLRVGIGLLSVLTGFTVVYVAIEPSLAVVALIALVHLGIALTCSYVLVQVTSAAASGDRLD